MPAETVEGYREPRTNRREDGTPPPPDAQTQVRIEPLFDRLLVQQKEEKTHEGKIEIAEKFREKPTEGLVLAVGPDCKAIKVGSTVLFHLFAGIEVPQDYGKNLRLIAEGEMIGLLHRG